MRLHSAAGDGYFESVDDGETWRRMIDGLEHQYCWSVAISVADPRTILLSASKSAYGAHYKESANSVVYRRTGSEAWKRVAGGLPHPQGLRIAVLAASGVEPGVFYCCSEGVVYRSEDEGLEWQRLAIKWGSGTAIEHATGMAVVEEP